MVYVNVYMIHISIFDFKLISLNSIQFQLVLLFTAQTMKSMIHEDVMNANIKQNVHGFAGWNISILNMKSVFISSFITQFDFVIQSNCSLSYCLQWSHKHRHQAQNENVMF